jgi:hypothetical protein
MVIEGPVTTPSEAELEMRQPITSHGAGRGDGHVVLCDVHDETRCLHSRLEGSLDGLCLGAVRAARPQSARRRELGTCRAGYADGDLLCNGDGVQDTHAQRRANGDTGTCTWDQGP